MMEASIKTLAKESQVQKPTFVEEKRERLQKTHVITNDAPFSDVLTHFPTFLSTLIPFPLFRRLIPLITVMRPRAFLHVLRSTGSIDAMEGITER